MKYIKIILGIVASFLFGAFLTWVFYIGSLILLDKIPNIPDWFVYVMVAVSVVLPAIILRFALRFLELSNAWCYYIIFVCSLGLSVWFVSLNSPKGQSPDSIRLRHTRQLASGLELYYNDFQSYPKDLNELVPKYIGVLPQTLTQDKVVCTKTESFYTYSSDGSDYKITFCLESSTGGYKGGVHY